MFHIRWFGVQCPQIWALGAECPQGWRFWELNAPVLARAGRRLAWAGAAGPDPRAGTELRSFAANYIWHFHRLINSSLGTQAGRLSPPQLQGDGQRLLGHGVTPTFPCHLLSPGPAWGQCLVAPGQCGEPSRWPQLPVQQINWCQSGAALKD